MAIFGCARVADTRSSRAEGEERLAGMEVEGCMLLIPVCAGDGKLHANLGEEILRGEQVWDQRVKENLGPAAKGPGS
jgi:hypothetical protein